MKTKLINKDRVNIASEEGKYITKFKDGDDITTFEDFNYIIVDKDDVENWREITAEQHRKYNYNKTITISKNNRKK